MDKVLWDKFMQIAVGTPQLVIAIMSGRFMGELWMYLYFNYYRSNKKSRPDVNNFVGKTAFGIIPMAPFAFICHFLKFGFSFPSHITMMDATAPTILLTMVFQFIVFVITVYLKGQ